jgi:soluble lytic murein transglycosylase-like protein
MKYLLLSLLLIIPLNKSYNQTIPPGKMRVFLEGCSVDTVIDPRSTQYLDYLQEIEKTHNLPTSLLYSIMIVESGGQVYAISPAGAEGLFQFMPRTSNWLQIDPYNPFEAAEGAAKYIRYLLNYFNQDLYLALAAYNAGMGNVRRYDYQVPPFPETLNYVATITAKINYSLL